MTTPTFTFIGLGIVAVAKKADTHEIEVHPQEQLPDVEGNVNVPVDQNGVNANATLKATYWQLDPYATTSPMVVEGDSVALLQYSDSQTYLWIPYEAVNTRLITHIEHRYPAKREVDTEDTDDNNWRVLLDTEEGILSLHTTTDRGEPVSYSIDLNTKDGEFSFVTNTGDIFTWDNASRQLTLETDTINSKAKLTTLEMDIRLKGNMDIQGNVGIKGNLSVMGSASISGNLSVGGSISAAGPVKGSAGIFPNVRYR